MSEEKIGEITHFFTNISVGVIKLSGEVSEDDEIHVKGSSTDFKQTVGSMEIDGNKVEKAGSGQSIGLKVKERVREGDEVFRVE